MEAQFYLLVINAVRDLTSKRIFYHLLMHAFMIHLGNICLVSILHRTAWVSQVPPPPIFQDFHFLGDQSNTNLDTSVKGFCRWNESPKSVELVIWRWLCGPNLITYPLKAESFLSWCENKSERQVSASLKKESKHVTCVVRGQVASKSWKWAWLMGSKTTKTSVLHLQGNEYLEENLKPQMSMCSLISACVTWSEDPANLYLGSWPKAIGR